MDQPPQCFFCSLPKARVLLETEHCLAFFDGFPVTEGHLLVIPKKHCPILHNLPPKELAEVWELVARSRSMLQEKYEPAGFNIGVNEGVAAGQTILHAHIHIIPRRLGDVPEPRGGVRWVIPEKAKYWE